MTMNVNMEVAALKVEVTTMKEEMREINRKLDDLLQLRYKGMGAFWLASILFGTGIIGWATSMFHYFYGGK